MQIERESENFFGCGDGWSNKQFPGEALPQSEDSQTKENTRSHSDTRYYSGMKNSLWDEW